MRRLQPVLALVAACGLFVGCPAPRQQAGAVALKLVADPAPEGAQVPVASPVQLRLRFDSGDKDRKLVGALIDDGGQAETKWFVEPEGAAEVDAATAQVRLKQPGKVKVWATYVQGGRTLQSNVVELNGVAAATSGS